MEGQLQGEGKKRIKYIRVYICVCARACMCVCTYTYIEGLEGRRAARIEECRRVILGFHSRSVPRRSYCATRERVYVA